MSAPEPVWRERRLSKERLRTLVRELVFDGDAVPAWHERAACAGMDETLFFPLGEGGPAGAERIEQAKAVCSGCPVQSACLADAMTRESPSARYGVFGSLTAVERSRLYVQLRDHARHLDTLTAAEDQPGAVA